MILLLGLGLISIPTSSRAGEEISRESEDWKKRLEMLRSVPYVGYSESTVDESDSGVVFYDLAKAYDGYNFYCTRFSGEAFLLDMDGRAIHRWTYLDIGEIGSYSHTAMLENGDLVVLKENEKLFRLNWDLQLLWIRELAAHHDVVQGPDGSLYVLVQEQRNHRGMGLIFDAIVHLTADGEEIDRWSTYDHLAEIKSALDTRSFLDTILDNSLGGRSHGGEGWHEFKTTIAARRYQYDYFHINTVNFLPANLAGEEDSRFQEGNFLVCFRNVNQIAVLERGTYRILWAWGEGELERPHHPTMLENGHILIFDNGVESGRSRVMELDPLTEIIVWLYRAQPPEDFYSSGGGSAQRLPNGNTLICDTNNGRVFEVTEGGETTWVWLNPSIRMNRRETVYRMMRLSNDQVDKLLKRK
jgi:hypothetical protein